VALRELPRDRVQNVRAAIACFEEALRVRTKSRVPTSWAMTMFNLAVASRYLAENEPISSLREMHLRRALLLLEDVFTVRRRDTDPYAWSITMREVGNVWHELGKTAASPQALEQALSRYGEALDGLIAVARGRGWAWAQYGLALTWLELAPWRGTAAVDEALGCLDSALTVYYEADFPTHWAKIQVARARAFLRSAALEDGPANLAAAEEHVRNALRVFTPEAFPHDHQKAADLLANIQDIRRAIGDAADAG